MKTKNNTKIINNNIVKTIKYSYNTISIKSNYFIVDGFLFETDNKTVLRKEKLSDCLNLKELNNKLFTAPILKQIQAYNKDNFKIVSIQDENNLLTIRLDNGSIIAKIQAVYSAIPENLLNLCNAKKELPKTFISYDLNNKQKRISSKYFSLIDTYLNHDFFICSKSDNAYTIIDNKAYYMFNGITESRKELLKNMSIEYLNNFLNNTYKITIQQPNKEQFNFTQFAIYYLIASLEQDKKEISRLEKKIERKEQSLDRAKEKSMEVFRNIPWGAGMRRTKCTPSFAKENLIESELKELKQKLNKLKKEQPKQAEKPIQSLLPVLYKTEQKTPVKSTEKPLQIEFKKQVLSLPCKQVYLLPMPEAVSLSAEKPKSKDYFADFEAKYLAKVREKKRYRKANSKFAGVLNEIGKFSSIACLIFLFLNSFVMIEKSNKTFENLAKMETKSELKQEIAKEAVKSISNFSDNSLSSTSYHLDNKTAKNSTSDGLKWISLVMFGIVRNKRKTKKQIKQQIKTYVLVLNEVKDTIFASRKVKDKIKSAKLKIKLLNDFF